MRTKDVTKIFILDTNVILHDHNCIYQFEDNDIVIPIIVLEELDKFKKGNEPINYHAREFVRMLDALSGNDIFEKGVPLGDEGGKLYIALEGSLSKKVQSSFKGDIPDHRILSTADHYAEKYPTKSIILVSKDLNLRMKAKAIGIMAEGYKNDNIQDVQVFEHSIVELTGLTDEQINELYQNKTTPFASLNTQEEPFPNGYYCLQGNQSTALARYNAQDQTLVTVEKHTAYGIKPRNAEQTFCLDALLNPTLNLVSVSGKAGTGKTLLALAAALAQHEQYDQILLARPIVALSNKDLGFLPGDAKEKISPYMQPLYDNLNVIKKSFNLRSKEVEQINNLLKEEKLLITPLAYIRGRSLNNTFVIVDEAQNLTPHEIKTVITRAGENTKMVFTGDIHQIDTPYLDMKSNGLAYMTERMKNQEVFAHIQLIKGERSKLAELASNLL